MKRPRPVKGAAFLFVCAGLFAGKPAPTGFVQGPVGAGLPAKRPALLINRYQPNCFCCCCCLATTSEAVM
ncbi:hypothetical protein FEM01_10380 [Pseudomonas mosselii]|uniref:Secreted protein n=1 Tax=Pseudomonas mosselii TaxID=78327 RepID=A0A5R8ZA09_9PSED|nr:hypothetical protein FEM01_10380 [Pseudomonas mosselii]